MKSLRFSVIDDGEEARRRQQAQPGCGDRSAFLVPSGGKLERDKRMNVGGRKYLGLMLPDGYPGASGQADLPTALGIPGDRNIYRSAATIGKRDLQRG